MKKLVFAVLLLALTAVSAHAGETTLGVAIRTLTNPYQANYKVGADAFAATVGLDAVILTCEGSSEKQVNDIKSLVARTQGDVVFMIDPNEATDILPVAFALEQEGVYFSTWWNKPDELNVWDFPHWVTHMAFDGIGAGKYTGEQLFASFKTPNKGKFIALQGMLANSTAADRFLGLQQAVAEHPGVELVAFEAADWDRTKAYEKTKNMLVANPDIEGVWAANDNMALGALEALRERGLAGKVLVTGVDGVDEIFDAIRKGEAAATVYNDSKYQAGISLAQTLAAKNGELDVASIPNERRQFFTAAVNVNRENILAFEEEYIKGSPKYDYKDYFGAWVRPME